MGQNDQELRKAIDGDQSEKQIPGNSLDATIISDNGGSTQDQGRDGKQVSSEFGNSQLNPGQKLGRYRIERQLGRGGFGEVYKAWDDELQRPVAIKVTFQRLLSSDSKENYLAEARTVAALDHPHIVPVYDVGQTPFGDYFVVSKLIDGSDLASQIHEKTISRTSIVPIVASIAEALHYAHGKGIVHRDVKPANILIDREGRAFLADFGIAMSEMQLGKGSGWAGTIHYMSPEQARGDGHRVDGRSDIYSLGVVLYELLTGRRPFHSSASTLELLELVAGTDVRPPRQFDDTISQRLERICLRALSRSLTERYSTAKDFAEDLRASVTASGLSNEKPVIQGKRVFELATSFRNMGCSVVVALGLLCMVSVGAWSINNLKSRAQSISAESQERKVKEFAPPKKEQWDDSLRNSESHKMIGD